MKKVCLLIWILLIALTNILAQSIADKLKTAVAVLEKDKQLRHAILGFYVADAKTGKAIFEKNAQVGLAPASTQKIITSVTAFELLGKQFRFKTTLGYNGRIADGVLKGNLFITGTGDPTLGSWRYDATKEDKILQSIVRLIKENKIQRIDGSVYIDEPGFSIQTIPDGWIWQDIGNYYGAGSWGFNWRENQYDLVLQPGKKAGDTTTINGTKNKLANVDLTNAITTANRGTGDNAYIYLAPYSTFGFATGTIPLGDNFTISGSMSNPPMQFAAELENAFSKNDVKVTGGYKYAIQKFSDRQGWQKPEFAIDSILSPGFEQINYWFLKKSINLYGEALIKTLAYRDSGFGSTDKGVEIVKQFWKRRNIEPAAINIIDGSGLSPQNRLTTQALGYVLLFAKTRSWFPSFYEALPVFNGMKIKSGSIGGARSFAGYHTSAGGKEYVFAVIVNNYDGSSADVVNKIYKLLDVLK